MTDVRILCSSRELFGADRSALRLAEVLGNCGVRPTLVLPANRPDRGLLAEAGDRGISAVTEPLAIASSKGVNLPAMQFAGRRATHAGGLTVINSSAVLYSAVHTPANLIILREWLHSGSLRHRLLVLRHAATSDAVVGVSRDVVRQWNRCTSRSVNQYVVHNWLDDHYIEKTGGIPRTNLQAGILCIGRFNAWKGQGVLADAYEAAFSRDRERPTLTFVGSQPDTSVDVQSATLEGRAERWSWQLFPFTPDPTEHFRKAALLVVPSLHPEPFGTVILEAIQHGCRVLAFEGGGPSDLARDFPDAITLVPRSTRHLTEALKLWWDDRAPALSSSEHRDASSIIRSRYSSRAAETAWRDVLESVLANQ